MPRKGQRSKRSKAPLTAAQKARRMRNLLPGGDNEAVKAAREKRRSVGKDILERVQGMDIIEFAHAAGISFEGRPGQELVLRLMYGLPLPEGRVKTYVRRNCEGFILEERDVSWPEYYTMLTGNARVFEPATGKTEGFLCVGARSGKTTITAVATLYEASRNKWLDYLRRKENGYAGIIATNLDQARDLIQQACLDMLQDSDLKGLIADEPTKRQITLTNGLSIRSFPCNTRAGRGFPYFFTCYDEAAFYYLEGAKADSAVHAAFNPRRLQFPGSKHMEITTPAGKQGRFYNEHSRGAQVHNRLTVQAPTWLFRPEFVESNPDFFKAEYESNPDESNREYGAEFDETIEMFLAEDDIAAALNLAGDAPRDASTCYGAGLDASGLSGNDRFGFAVSGRDPKNGRHTVAAVRSWSEKDPDPIMADIRDLCHRYGVWRVFTDRYAKGWVHAGLRKIGLEPVLAPSGIEVWMNAKTLLSSRKTDMPLDKELEEGLRETKKAYGASQTPRIVRPRSRKGHGDKAEAAAKALWASSQDAWGARPASAEDRRQAERRKQEQENYNPLTWGRV